VDVDLLSRRDVTLSVLPDYATGAVAEHALAMLMSLAARVHLANDRSRGLADSETSLRGVELGGRTLAILGLGRIGRRLATLAAGIGMRVVGADVDHAARVRAAATGVAVTELDTALARADAVAVTASHRFEGPALLGPAELHAMRRGALLVNVGRRALVDTAAACAMLRAGRLRGYAVDDVVVDPAAAADLVEQGRLLQTGHSAWWRDEVLERGRLKWGEALLDAVQGKPRDVVTAPAGAQEGQATAAAGAGM
jgi:lactate dehydrogenase-like 2-hydroxyacid dehydrogenase